MRFAVFFAVIFVLLGALSYYVHRRASREFNLSLRARRALAGVLIAGVLSMLVGRLLGNLLPDVVIRAIGTAGYVVMLGILMSSVLLAVVDLPRAMVRLVSRLARRGLPQPVLASAAPAAVVDAPPSHAGALAPEADPALKPAVVATSPSPSPSALPAPPASPAAAAASPSRSSQESLPRRTFLTQAAAGSAFLIGGGSSLYGAVFGRHDYIIEEIPIRIPGLPKSLDGYTIVQLSDIHIGLYVGEPELRAAEELVRKARADVVVLTGDLIDFDPRYADTLGSLARRLTPLARDGVVAIPGNHDYFTGIDEVTSALSRGGADVLRNSGRIIGDAKQGFALLGVDDVWAERLTPRGGPDLARAIASVPRDLPRVLLCHNPVFFPEAAGQVALQLSGHTHGGQVNLFVRPGEWVLPHGYIAGQYQRGDSRLYINRGFGTAGPPARIGAPPEVTKVVLVSA